MYNLINMQWGIFIDPYIRRLYTKFECYRWSSFWGEEAGKIVHDAVRRQIGDNDNRSPWEWFMGPLASKLKIVFKNQMNYSLLYFNKIESKTQWKFFQIEFFFSSENGCCRVIGSYRKMMVTLEEQYHVYNRENTQKVI